MSRQLFGVVSTISVVAVVHYATVTHDKIGTLTAIGIMYLLAIPLVRRLGTYTIGSGNLKLETSPRIRQLIYFVVGLGVPVREAMTVAPTGPRRPRVRLECSTHRHYRRGAKHQASRWVFWTRSWAGRSGSVSRFSRVIPTHR